MPSYSSSINLSDGIQINAAKPIDVRTIVDSVEDLANVSYAYTGMIIGVKGTSDLYVLTSNAKGAKNISNWKKTGSSSGASVLDSVDKLSDGTTITSPYQGMFAVVSGSSDSDDEDGLYVLLNTPATTASNWMKVGVGSTYTSNADITTDGTTPSSGNGFSIDPEDSDAYVEDIYLDDDTTCFKANTYYTGRGFSSSVNGGDLNTGYIDITNGGSSYIRFFSSTYNSGSGSDVDGNWVELCINDSTLGIETSNVKYVVSGVEHTMNTNTIILSFEDSIYFTKDFNITGMTETRNGGSTEYLFGSTGSSYTDLDIFTSNVLPTVYVYAGDTSVRILTEGDKEEIVNMITETNVTPITDDEIESLFE